MAVVPTPCTKLRREMPEGLLRFIFMLSMAEQE
jgi:hypothetical protein